MSFETNVRMIGRECDKVTNNGLTAFAHLHPDGIVVTMKFKQYDRKHIFIWHDLSTGRAGMFSGKVAEMANVLLTTNQKHMPI